MGFISAKFASKCEETGYEIKPKAKCFFDTKTRRVFHPASPRYRHELLEQKNKKFYPA